MLLAHADLFCSARQNGENADGSCGNRRGGAAAPPENDLLNRRDIVPACLVGHDADELFDRLLRCTLVP